MSFHSETSVKAVRKRHLCDGCRTYLEIGEPAVRWAGMTDGDFGTAIYHPECRTAEVAYNQDFLGFQYGDDWYPLDELDTEGRAWLIEAHPLVAARMMMTSQPQSGDAAQVVQPIRDEPLLPPQEQSR